MAYVPNATTVTEPIESRSVESAALEFRTLKEKVVENSNAILTALRDSSTAIGVLPSAALRAGKALVFDGAGNPAAAAIGDAADPGLRSDLAASTGAALVGYNGGSVKAALDNLKQPSTETYAGVVELATGAEAAAGTDTTRVLTPAGLRSGLNSTGSAPIYAVRAWVNFNGFGSIGANQTIRGAGNVSSVYKNGTGDYTVNFANAMPDANYAITTCVEKANGSYIPSAAIYSAAAPSPGSFRILTGSENLTNDRSLINVAVIR